MVSRTQQRTSQHGFTLLELALVLVIIGLIVGGILVGQDLIKSAEIRATITQIEKFNAAATTFRDKFGGLPGDLTDKRVVQFGFVPAGRAANPGEGNNNGLIESFGGNPLNLAGETVLFWSDLAQADLVANAVDVASVTLTGAGSIEDLPTARMRDTAAFYVSSVLGQNFFYLAQFTFAASPTMGMDAGISPLQAFAVDQKIDNGNGAIGMVIAIDAVGGATPNHPTADTGCMDNTGIYNTLEANANVIACSLAIRAAF